MIGVGVVGYGYWGPNLVRNFNDVPDARVRKVCDLRSDRVALARQRYPTVEATRSEERRVGKECTSWCRSRWWPYH